MKLKIEDKVQLKGTFCVRVWRGTPKRINNEWVGDLKVERIIDNIMTIVGKQLVLNLLARKSTIVGLQIIGIGTGVTAETENDTDLVTEVARENITFTSTISGSGESMTYSAFFGTETPGTTQSITEAGMFGNGATLVADSGDMFSRKTFTAVEKQTGVETLTVDYTLTYP
jgi:hypothetical protein